MHAHSTQNYCIQSLVKGTVVQARVFSQRELAELFKEKTHICSSSRQIQIYRGKETFLFEHASCMHSFNLLSCFAVLLSFVYQIALISP